MCLKLNWAAHCFHVHMYKYWCMFACGICAASPFPVCMIFCACTTSTAILFQGSVSPQGVSHHPVHPPLLETSNSCFKGKAWSTPNLRHTHTSRRTKNTTLQVCMCICAFRISFVHLYTLSRERKWHYTYNALPRSSHSPSWWLGADNQSHFCDKWTDNMQWKRVPDTVVVEQIGI